MKELNIGWKISAPIYTFLRRASKNMRISSFYKGETLEFGDGDVVAESHP